MRLNTYMFAPWPGVCYRFLFVAPAWSVSSSFLPRKPLCRKEVSLSQPGKSQRRWGSKICKTAHTFTYRHTTMDSHQFMVHKHLLGPPVGLCCIKVELSYSPIFLSGKSRKLSFQLLPEGCHLSKVQLVCFSDLHTFLGCTDML